MTWHEMRVPQIWYMIYDDIECALELGSACVTLTFIKVHGPDSDKKNSFVTNWIWQ